MLEKRLLSDGSIITLRIYTLPDNVADTLKRPKGSYEACLEINHKNLHYYYGFNYTTSPKVSWFVDINTYQRIFNNVKNKCEFLNIAQFMNKIVKSNKDIKKLEEYLKSQNI